MNFEGHLVRRIQRNLSDDLLLPKYQRRARTSQLAGHCYVASEALYHLLPNKEVWTPRVTTWGSDTHWYLQDTNGRILDPTAAQFDRKTIEWIRRNSRGTGFLTKKPSKRAQKLIARIKGD